MKAKIINLSLLVTLLLLGCEEKHSYPDEIVFDSGVSATQITLGESVVFTDYSSGVVSRAWTFPGGTPAASVEKQLNVSFSQVGLITCTIENTFSDGITESKNIFLQVGSGLINYSVSARNTTLGSPITFKDNSNSVASRVWSFPGGIPATSTDTEVSVDFSQEGPVLVSLEVTFLNGITDTETINIQVGTEQYVKSVFGFENKEEAEAVWQTWVSNGTDAAVFSVENSAGAGALGTDGFAKIVINQANVESQLYTKNVIGYPNAVLESNKNYEFSFWIRSDDFTQITAAELSNETEEQIWKNFAWYSPIPEVTSDWSYKSVIFSTGDLTQDYSEGRANNAWTQFKFVQSGTGTIYIDEVSLKENN